MTTVCASTRLQELMTTVCLHHVVGTMHPARERHQGIPPELVAPRVAAVSFSVQGTVDLRGLQMLWAMPTRLGTRRETDIASSGTTKPDAIAVKGRQFAHSFLLP